MPPDPKRFDDLFAPFGPIVVRRMFGGEGLFRDGLMFALVYRERIYFKTDDQTRNAFLAEDCGPFIYPLKDGEQILTSYHALPDRLYDDPEELADWARKAFAVALNSPTAQRKQRRAGKDGRRRKVIRR